MSKSQKEIPRNRQKPPIFRKNVLPFVSIVSYVSYVSLEGLSEISPHSYFLCKNFDVFIWEGGQPGYWDMGFYDQDNRDGNFPISREHSSPVTGVETLQIRMRFSKEDEGCIIPAFFFFVFFFKIQNDPL